MEKCRLCLLKKPLLRKSHIIPDFMYQRIYDDNHKLRLVDIKNMREGISRIKKPSTGLYEGGLLCKECDGGVLGSYESYSKNLILGGNFGFGKMPTLHDHVDSTGVVYTNLKNVDYQKYKLFLLSILWRASISQNIFFEEVDLGDHEEIIRLMLVSSNPGSSFEYPINVIAFGANSSIPLIILKPKKSIRDGLIKFEFPILSSCYNFYIHSKELELPLHVSENTIRTTGEFNIIHVPNGLEMDYINSFFIED